MPDKPEAWNDYGPEPVQCPQCKRWGSPKWLALHKDLCQTKQPT